MKFNCTYTDLVLVNAVIPNPANNNRHNVEQIERLAEIIERQGQRRPIIVSRSSKKLIEHELSLLDANSTDDTIKNRIDTYKKYLEDLSRQEGFLNCGHATLEAIKLLGWEQVAVDYQEFPSLADEYANLTADNELARWSQLDNHLMLHTIDNLGLNIDNKFLGLPDFDVSDQKQPTTVEFEANGFGSDLEHKCPKCGFEFND